MYRYSKHICIMFVVLILSGNPFGFGGQPVPHSDVFTAIEGQPLLIDLIANDNDEDGEPLIVILTNPGQPTCWGKSLNQLLIDNQDGSFILKTPLGISGSCTFTYTLEGGPATQTLVQIHISNASDLAPKVDAQPTLSQAKLAENATFAIIASPPVDLNYQWKKDGTNLANTSRYEGVNTSNLTINGIVREDIGSYQCEVSNSYGTAVSENAPFALVTHLDSQAPFYTSATALPGILEAEFYDVGPANDVFYDTTFENSGAHCRTGDVDIARDSNGNYYLSEIQTGEWVQYSFHVETETRFDLILTAAAEAAQAPNGIRFSLEIDGNAFVCNKTYPTTGGPETWQSFTIPAVTLESGTHQMRFIAESDGWHLNRFEFVSNSQLTSAPFTSNGSPHPIGVVQFENFDTGGQAIAYSDTTGSNLGTYCERLPDSPDLYQSGTRIHLGSIEPSEWLLYTVDVPQGTHDYDLVIRYRSNGAGIGTLQFEVSEDGFTRSISLPENQTQFTEITVPGMQLSGGTKKLKFSFPNPNYALDNFELKSAFPPVPLRVTTLEGSPVNPGSIFPVGETHQNVPLEKTFTLHNDHVNQTLYLSNFQVSGTGWSSDQPLPLSIPAQSSANFTIQLFSVTPLPNAMGTISFETSGANTDDFAFQTSGEVIESTFNLQVEYFHISTNINEWRPQPGTAYFLENHRQFRIRNGGNVPISGRISLLNNQYFSFFQPTVPFIEYTLPPEIAGSNDHILEFFVQFDDTILGDHDAIVDIDSDHENGDFQFAVQKTTATGDPITFSQSPIDAHLINGSSGWVTFSLMAEGGTNEFDYQWEFQEDHFTGKWVAFYPSGPFPNFNGQNTNTLNVEIPVDFPIIHNRFRCYIVDRNQTFVSRYSGEVQVIYNDPIQITQHPQDVWFQPGEPAVFQAEGGEGSHQVSYQWQFQAHGTNSWADLQAVTGKVSGTQTHTLTLTEPESHRVGKYRCKVFEPLFPANAAFSDAASLSLLRFTLQPADVFSFGKADFQVSVDAAGLPVTYQWFANGSPINDDHQYQGTQTATLHTNIADTEFNTYFCAVSDDYVSFVESWPAQRRWVFGGGTFLADTFHHGHVAETQLHNETTPFRGLIWSSSSQIVHRNGNAFETAGNFADALAQVTFFPPAETRIILQTRFALDLEDIGNWIDLGFYNQDSPAIVMRVRHSGLLEIYHEDQLIGSGTGNLSTSFWRFEIDQTTGTVSVSDGGGVIATGTIALADFPFISRAGFAFHKAQASGQGNDFRVSDFWVRAVSPIAAEDDVVDFDKDSSPSLSGIQVLSNDQGNNIAIAEIPGPHAEHGTVTVHPSGKTLTYTPDPDWLGWDRIIYQIHSPQTLDSSFAFVHVFVHQGLAFSARNDWVEAPSNQVTTIDVTSNDYNGNPLGSLEIQASNPIGSYPKSGVVQFSSDNAHFVYTPQPGFKGIDSFTYRIVNEAGQTSLGRVDVVISGPFKGILADDFDPVATHRGSWLPTHGKQTQWGEAIFRKTDLVSGSTGIPVFFDSNHRIATQEPGYLVSPRTWTALPKLLNKTISGPNGEDGFEAGNFNSWTTTQDNINAPQLSLSENAPISGEYSMQVALPGGANKVAGSKLDLGEPKAHVRWGINFQMREMTYHPTASFNISRGIPSFPGGPMVQVRGLPSPQVRLVAIDNNQRWRSKGWVDLPAEGETAALEFEWWAGDAKHPYGGVRLFIDGILKHELTTIENLDQRITHLFVGVNHNANSDFSGKLLFDDFSWHSEGVMVLEASVKFNHASQSNEKFQAGFASHPELAFDAHGQTSLYLQLEPGRYEVRQQNKSRGIDTLINSGSYSHTAGQTVAAEMEFNPGNRAVSLRINGYEKVNQNQVDSSLKLHQLQTVGWLIKGLLMTAHRVEHFSYRSPVVTSQAFDDHYQIVRNEIPTIDIRINDFEVGNAIPIIVTPPQTGKVLVNGDGTITYQPNAVGDDSFTYSITANNRTSQAQVTFQVQGGFSEEIPLIKMFDEDFETRNFTKWEKQGEAERSDFEAYPAIRGGVSYKVTQPGGDTKSAWIRHTSEIDANYARIQFKFDIQNEKQIEGATSKLLVAYGHGQYLFDVRYRPEPNRAIQLVGVSQTGYSLSDWIPLDTSSPFQTIEIEWWDNHPGKEGPGLRLWLNDNQVFEELDFTFRKDYLDRIDLGVISPDDNQFAGNYIFDDVKIWRSAYKTEFKDGFEIGTTPWDTVVDHDGKIQSNTTAPIGGDASMDVVVPGGDSNQAFVLDSLSPTKTIRAQFKFSPNTVAMPSNAAQVIFRGDASSGVLLRGYFKNEPQPQFLFSAKNLEDIGIHTSWHNLLPDIESNGHILELEWWSERTFKAGGGMRLWLDGTLVSEKTNQAFTGQELQATMLGIAGYLNSGISGSFLFDDYRAWVYRLRD